MTNERISSCCGATEQTDLPFNSDGGYCFECRDHCEYIAFEDADGNETPMYVNESGYLQDDPIANAVGKAMAITALVCAIAFYVGSAGVGVK